MLERLNDLLQSENEKLVSEYHDESYPVFFIVAHPRGASTLLQQILISNLHVGYISNFLAKFYKTPLFGLSLEKDILDSNYKSDCFSSYGNTSKINEPHEWGWFWKYMLCLEGQQHYTKLTDFSSLKQNLLGITNYRKLPLIIDNVYAMSNIVKFKDQINNIKIIDLTRDLYFVCNSIINARLSRYDDITHFYGHPPENIEDVLKINNPIEQVVFQVKSIQDEIDVLKNCFSNHDIFTVDYDALFEDSSKVVDEFHYFTKQFNVNLDYKEKYIPELVSRNDSTLIRDEYKQELDYFYKKYFGNESD